MIENLEQEERDLFAQMSDPDFYKSSGDIISSSKSRVETLKKELETAYARWEELEAIKEASS